MREFLTVVGATVLSVSAVCAAPPATEILKKADDVRNPRLDYRIWVKITSYMPHAVPKESKIEVYVKGKNKTITRTHTPKLDRGQVMLNVMHNLWIFLSAVAKPIRISLQERLMGEIANGDIARMNFSADYNPILQGREKIKGKAYYVLKLKAKSEDVTYGTVLLWVETGTFRPFKAKFYAFSGRLLKICTYENYGPLGGRSRPRRLVFTDAVKKDHYSTIEYDKVEIGALPDKYFTKNYMKRFSDF